MKNMGVPNEPSRPVEAGSVVAPTGEQQPEIRAVDNSIVVDGTDVMRLSYAGERALFLVATSLATASTIERTLRGERHEPGSKDFKNPL
jgi:hypothetical protein